MQDSRNAVSKGFDIEAWAPKAVPEAAEASAGQNCRPGSGQLMATKKAASGDTAFHVFKPKLRIARFSKVRGLERSSDRVDAELGSA